MGELRKLALSQRVFDELEGRIVDRVYPPGTHLVEDSIAAELGVSRTPVREAFRLLHRAGWIDLRPHAGAYVRYPTIQEVRELFEFRRCLEQRACELAAERATEADRRRLEKILEQGLEVARKGDVKAVAELNSRFHEGVALAARNDFFARALEDLGKHVRWHFSAVANIRGMDSWQEHRDILGAIAMGDPRRAGELAAEHAARTQAAYFEHLLETDHGAG